MLDRDLDALLRDADPARLRPAQGAALVRDLVEQTRVAADGAGSPAHSQRRLRARRPVLIGGLIAGAVAVSAAGTLTAYQLSVPPFQTVEDRLQRAATPIPLDYVRAADGATVRCSVFLEFRHLDPAALQQLQRVIRSTSWTAARQAQLLGRPADAPPPTTESEVFPRGLLGGLYSFARTAVPDLALQRDAGQRPVLNGYGASCRPVGL